MKAKHCRPPRKTSKNTPSSFPHSFPFLSTLSFFFPPLYLLLYPILFYPLSSIFFLSFVSRVTTNQRQQLIYLSELAGVSAGPNRKPHDGLHRSLKTLWMVPDFASLLPLSNVSSVQQNQWLARSWHAWMDLSLYTPLHNNHSYASGGLFPEHRTPLKLISQPRHGLPSRCLGPLSDPNSCLL